MAQRKHYDRDFRLQAAKLVVEHGYKYKEAAERLGVSEWSIRQWIDKFRKEGTLPSEKQLAPTGEELIHLRKENKQLKLENEILKKAAAYFAKDSL